jgi:hypothetical protein
MLSIKTNLVKVSVEGSKRLVIPRRVSEDISWMEGNESILAWLLVLEGGRYRLLSDEQVRTDALLEPVRSLVVAGKVEDPVEPSFVQVADRAALAVRLLSIDIKPSNSSWRFTLPEAIWILKPDDCNANYFVMLLAIEGYWEIWHPEVLRRAASTPLSFR